MDVMSVMARLKILTNRFLGKNLGCNQTYTDYSYKYIVNDILNTNQNLLK